MTDRAQAELSRFLQNFKLRSLWTARLVSCFDDADMTLRPAEGSMSTTEQVAQICGSNNFLKQVLAGGPLTSEAFKRDFSITDVNSALRAIRQITDEVMEAGQQMNPQSWDEIIEPFGPDPQWRISRGQTAYALLDHESHHRGQLTVYLRLAGKTPPVLYAPVDETEIFLGID
jgi:uncharacterized damage-inducible protein DinB